MPSMCYVVVASLIGLAFAQNPQVTTENGDLSLVVADGKRIGFKIGGKEIKFGDVSQFGGKDYTDGALTAVQMGYSLAMPAMCKIPAVEVQQELHKLSNAVKYELNNKNFDLELKTAELEAKVESMANIVFDLVNDTVVTMDAKLSDAQKEIENNVLTEVDDFSSEFTVKLNDQLKVTDGKLASFTNLKKQMDTVAAHPEWKWLAKPDDIKADNALKTVEAACSANANCILTAAGYNGRRFFKIRFNPNRPGYFTEGFVELSQGCHDLNEYLKVNAKPYGLDRKLKPVCDHTSVSMASGCTYLPYSYFSQCISNHHYGHGLQQSMCQNGIFYNNGWWNNWAMLYNRGSGSHSWAYMRQQSTSWQYTLCSSGIFSGDDVYWKN